MENAKMQNARLEWVDKLRLKFRSKKVSPETREKRNVHNMNLQSK